MRQNIQEAHAMSSRRESPGVKRLAMKIVVAVSALLLSVNASYAHHSPSVYSRSGVIEAEGEIAEVAWVNPHVRFKRS
jgi:hypothetical protein